MVVQQLKKRILVDFHFWGFAFHQHPGLEAAVEDQQIESPGPNMSGEFFFHGQCIGRIVHLLQKMPDKPLSHPFFGIQFYPKSAYGIVDLNAFFAAFHGQSLTGQIQGYHLPKLRQLPKSGPGVLGFPLRGNCLNFRE